MKFVIQLCAGLIFILSLPAMVSGQSRAIAENLCYQFSGEIHAHAAPVALKNRYSNEPFTCIVQQDDSLSVYEQAREVISKNRQWKILIGRDWRVTAIGGKEYRYINIEMKGDTYLVLIVPVESSDRFYFRVVIRDENMFNP